MNVDAQQLLEQLNREAAQWRDEHAEQMRSAALNFELSLGRKVQSLREGRGWSQNELAQRMDACGFALHQTTVAKLEAGKRPLRVAEVVVLATIFELAPAALFYLPLDGEPFSIEYQRIRLERLDDLMGELKRMMLTTIETQATSYADLAAERTWLVDGMRRAGEVTDGGEHQEEA